MGGPFTDKLRQLAGKLTVLNDTHGALSNEEADDLAETLDKAAQAIELLEAELEDVKR